MDNKPSSPIPVGSLVRLFNKLTDERLGNADGVVLNFHKDKSHPGGYDGLYEVQWTDGTREQIPIETPMYYLKRMA